MSRLPLTDRPHAVLVDATIAAGNVTITCPYAVLFLAKEEGESADTDAPAQKPGLARCLPPNVIALRRTGTR